MVKTGLVNFEKWPSSLKYTEKGHFMEKNDFTLWQMVNQKAMGLKGNILIAMECYTRRTGKYANLVEVNEADLNGEAIDCIGFEIKAVNTVLPGTLMVGRVDHAEI